jgi:uncharacterized lipoprotein YehR (DUF1307 family)
MGKIKMSLVALIAIVTLSGCESAEEKAAYEQLVEEQTTILWLRNGNQYLKDHCYGTKPYIDATEKYKAAYAKIYSYMGKQGSGRLTDEDAADWDVQFDIKESALADLQKIKDKCIEKGWDLTEKFVRSKLDD